MMLGGIVAPAGAALCATAPAPGTIGAHSERGNVTASRLREMDGEARCKGPPCQQTPTKRLTGFAPSDGKISLLREETPQPLAPRQ